MRILFSLLRIPLEFGCSVIIVIRPNKRTGANLFQLPLIFTVPLPGIKVTNEANVELHEQLMPL